DPVEGTNFNEWRANGWDVNGTTVGYASGTPALPGHAVPFQLAVYGPVQGCDGVLVPAQAGQLATLVAANPPSTTFCLAPGIHYETQVEPKDGNRFIGEPGAILSGAKVLDPAQAVHHFGDIYYWEGQTQEGFSNGQIISGGNDRDLHPEELFVNGDTRYRHVEAVLPYHDADKDPALDWVDEPGEWFFDYEADRIYIYGNPAGSLIETSVKEFAIAPVWWNYASAADYPDDVVIENLVVEKYANPGQFGAIGAQAHGANGSDSWTLRHVEVRYTHACGVRLVNGGTIENASIHHNGQIGVCGSGDGDEASLPVTIVDSEVRDNRVLDFNPTWEGGGVKLVHFGDASVANTAVVGNAGPGFISHEVESLDFLRNLVSGNSHTPVAIRHTPTGSAVVHRNQILDNGIESVGDEGAGVEIRHHGSTTGLVTTAITENLIDGNRWGLFAPDVDGTNHAYTATDNVIRAADPGHWVHQIRHTTSSAPNTVVDRNTYHVTSQSDTRWFYGAAGQPLSGMNFATWPYDGMGSTATFGTAPQMPVGGEAYQAAAYGPRLRAL
ncbi:MAG: right-handed parallel beta-helix repeat-containing protein, partial [Actinomycetota bacterium]